MIKSKLQSHKIADLLDVNLNPGQIESQLLYLKRKIEAYKISDLLDINLNAGQLQAQLTALSETVAKNPITIPVNLDINLADLIALEGMTLGIGVGVSGSASPVFDVIARNTADSSASLMQKVALEIEMNAILVSGFESVVRAINSNGDMLSHDLIMLRALGGGGGKNVVVPPTGGGGGRGWGGWWGWLGGGSIAGIAAWHIALDGLLEALIAVISALAAFAVGALALKPTLQDIYTNFKSISNVNDALGNQIPTLGQKFNNLASSSKMAGLGIELYGGAINIVNHNSGILNSVANRVVNMFDTWIAKVVVWNQTSRTMGKILQDGVGFLHQFGQMAGYLGDALFNLIKAMPGVAHYLMDILVAATRVFDVFTKIPTPVLAFVLALHGIYIWGRLGIGILLTLGTRLGIVSTEALASYRKMSLLGMLKSPITWALAAAAGIGFLIHKITEVDPAVTSMITGMENQLGKLPTSSLFAALSQDIATLQSKAASVSISQPSAFDWLGKAFTTKGMAGVSALGHAISAFFKNTLAPPSIFGSSQQNSIAAMDAEINKMIGSGRNLYAELGNLQNKGMGFHQALALMDLAGVKWNDNLAVMETKVNNLITGYQRMSVSGGILANTVNAVNFATLQQQSNITNLTGGWTAFFGTLISGENGFTSFVQSVQSMQAALKISRGNITGLKTDQIASRAAFLAAAQAAQTQANNLMTMASAAGMGAHGTALVTSAVQSMVARMLPAAKTSAGLTGVLYGLAQQGGYRGADSFKALSKWVSSIHHPMKNLDNITTILTEHMGNLTTDVKNLSVALGTNLTQAEANAIAMANNATKDFNTTAKALYNDGINSKQFHDSLVPLATMLLTTMGNTRKAHDQFDAFMIMMGLNKKQADQLWGSIDHVATSMAKLKNHSFAISETATGTGHFSISQISSLSKPGGKLAGPLGRTSGWLVPGYGGGDKWPALLEGGETVVPKHLTPYVAWLMKRHGVPGFSGGGFVGRNAPGNIGLANWNTNQFNNFTSGFRSQFGSVFTKDLVSATVAAQKAAQAAAAAAAAISGGAHGGPATGGAAAAQAYARSRLAAYGWGSSQMVPLIALWNQESGWNRLARNPTSGAYGIPQALPPGKMGSAANPPTSSMAAQVNWGLGYIRSVYGTPAAAEAHELAVHWYRNGLRNGLFTRPTVIGVGDGGPERVSVTPSGQSQNQTIVLEVAPGGSGAFEQFMTTFLKQFVRTHGGGDPTRAFQGYR